MRIFRTPKGTELPIIDMRGKDYLEVKWRLVWFREEHPTWGIMTEFVSVTDKDAFAKATIYDERNCVISTGHKFEDKAGFGDFREKAETGAIGRALALIGYGTQFCADDLDEGKRIADAPVERKGSISVQQPHPGDGNTDPTGYRVGFGQWRGKSLEQIYNEVGPEKMASYLTFLEQTADKKGQELGTQAKEFIYQVEQFLGAMENHAPPATPEAF